MILVPDNLKSAVIKANNYEPEINSDYANLARHYGYVVIPARVLRSLVNNHSEILMV